MGEKKRGVGKAGRVSKETGPREARKVEKAEEVCRGWYEGTSYKRNMRSDR